MVHNALAMPWVVPVVFGCLVAIVAIIANTVASTLRANAEMNLKRTMVEHGYTADDIARVIRASSPGNDDSEEDSHDSLCGKSSKPPKQYKVTV